jgi:hypothetical protein
MFRVPISSPPSYNTLLSPPSSDMASTLPLKSALHTRFLYLNRYHFLPLRQQVHNYSYAYGPKSHCPYRSMATMAAPAKTDWLIIVPDSTGVLSKRMEVRPYNPRFLLNDSCHILIIMADTQSWDRKHFEELGAGLESGFWKMGGRRFTFVLHPIPP